MFQVEIVPTHQIQALRQLVLWPHLSVSECVIEPDELESTYQMVVKHQNQVVCCGTFLKEDKANFEAHNAYRLRAMGTHPEYRNQGLGKMLIEYAMEYLQTLNVDLIWCDARIEATGFYQKMGFEKVGDIYDVPLIGPHYLMYIRLS